MPRVAGIDAGTVSLDVCGLDDGRLFLDATWSTAAAMTDPGPLIDSLARAGPLDLVVAPSGYGLPLVEGSRVTDEELRLAFLSRPDDSGGIEGIGRLARRLVGTGLPLVFIPGVIHLDTVPRHRKLNRVDLGTADKVSAAALAIHEQAERTGRSPEEVSLILVELGGAFTACLAVERGQIVDGVGGTSGPIGWQSAGALDGEVAFLAGEVTKATLFQGGVATFLERNPSERALAVRAYTEGAARMVGHLRASAPQADEVVLSGRMAADPEVLDGLRAQLAGMGVIRPLRGFAGNAKQGAQGAALIADGLAGGAQSALVERTRLRHAAGSVLDHLYVITPAAARQRLGLDSRA